MNINRLIILWVLGSTILHELDVLGGIAYILVVAPAILLHAFRASTANSVGEMKDPDSTGSDSQNEADGTAEDVEQDVVMVDREYTERIELSIGGYVELDCWKEVPVKESDVNV